MIAAMKCACAPVFSDAASFAHRIAIEISASSCTAALAIVLLLPPFRFSSSSDDIWGSLLSALSVMPAQLAPSVDLLKVLQAATALSASSSQSTSSNRKTNQNRDRILPEPGTALAVSAVAALNFASAAIRSSNESSSADSLIGSVLYSVAITFASLGKIQQSRSLLTTCGRLNTFVRWRCARALVTLLSEDSLSRDPSNVLSATLPLIMRPPPSSGIEDTHLTTGDIGGSKWALCEAAAAAAESVRWKLKSALAKAMAETFVSWETSDSIGGTGSNLTYSCPSWSQNSDLQVWQKEFRHTQSSWSHFVPPLLPPCPSLPAAAIFLDLPVCLAAGLLSSSSSAASSTLQRPTSCTSVGCSPISSMFTHPSFPKISATAQISHSPTHSFSKFHVVFSSTDYGHTVMLSFLRSHLQRFKRSRVTLLCVASPSDRLKHSKTQWRRELVTSSFVSFVEADIGDGPATAEAAASAINNLRAHAAVHLDGHNGDSLIAAFALHPASLQLHYRFISTAAAPFLPLYVTDSVVAPVEYSSVLFTEKLIFLPPSYLPNQVSDLISSIIPCNSGSPIDMMSCLLDHRRHTLSRLNVPHSSTVIAAFSRPAKVDIGTFNAWISTLIDVPGSVLLLIDFNSAGVRGMRSAAASAGLSDNRIVSVQPMVEEEFAGLSCAVDLVLDTPTCNGHTTVTYSTHCGAPLLSAALMRPSARVAASLLRGATRFDDSFIASPALSAPFSSTSPSTCIALHAWVLSGRSPPSIKLPFPCHEISKGILARTLADYRDIAVLLARNLPLLHRWKTASFATRSALFEEPRDENFGGSWASSFDAGLHMAAEIMQVQRANSISTGYRGGHIVVNDV